MLEKNRAGNNQLLKEMNKAKILDLIRTHDILSRSDIAEMTGLSATAAGAITSILLEEGFVYETGTGESKGGRKPVMLQIKPNSYYALGVDIEVNTTRMVLMDLTGQVIEQYVASAEEEHMLPKRRIQTIAEHLVRLLNSQNIQNDKILGIGISVPGLIDVHTGKLVLAPNLDWKNFDVVLEMQKHLNIPVYLENEAMSSAIYENWLGECKNIENFVCINIQSGIGAGIFANGRPFKGSRGSAGEVGHIVVDENGPKCGCGNYGCLESLASIESMEMQARKMVRQGAATALNAIQDSEDITMDQIIDCAEKGDEFCRLLLNQSARYTALAISDIVNLLNPSVIVLGKEFVKYSDMVMQDICTIVMKKSLNFPASDLKIIASRMGAESSALGAASIPLKKLFGKL